MSLKNFIFTCLTILMLTTFSGCANHIIIKTARPTPGQTENIFHGSGANTENLRFFLNSCTTPRKREAAEFLVANLPPCDKVSLSAKLLKENLDYAFLARRSTKWGRHVSWPDFMHYVLPHRVSQEQAVSWRKKFYEELMPIVSNCQNIKEATLAVNRWCFSKTGFKSTQRWDQNPLMTINRGWARCEEAVILTVCALRSVGIPARQSLVPAWQHCDDNHTWTEVLIDGKWHYLESANPDYGLDHAWFTPSARKAPLVVALAYGQIENSTEIIDRPFGCTLINRTERYAPASKFKINVTDGKNNPLAGVDVNISVYNYASFTRIAKITTDKNGKAEIVLGPGSVLITAAQDGKSSWAISSWIPFQHPKRPAISLQLLTVNEPEGKLFLPFAFHDDESPAAPIPNSEGARKTEFDTIKTERLKRFANMTQAAKIFAPEQASVITRAGLNQPEIMAAIEDCPPALKDELTAFLENIATADLLNITKDELLHNVAIAHTARAEARQAGLAYSSEIYNNFVLPSRIMYEQRSFWRGTFHHAFNLRDSMGIQEFIVRLNKITNALGETKRGPLGSSIPPIDVFRSNLVSNEYETGVFATAALRAAGIPARYLIEQKWIEYFDGNEWLPFFPRNPELTGNKNGTEQSKKYYAEWNDYKVNITQFKDIDRDVKYYKDYTLSTFSEQGTYSIIPKNTLLYFSQNKTTLNFSTHTSPVLIMLTKRNKNKEPSITITKINN